MTYPIHFSLWVFTSSAFKGFFQNYQKTEQKTKKNPEKPKKYNHQWIKSFSPIQPSGTICCN